MLFTNVHYIYIYLSLHGKGGMILQSAIVGIQRQLTEADAVSIKKPQGRYKLTSPSDWTALCTLIDVTTVAMDVLFLLY